MSPQNDGGAETSLVYAWCAQDTNGIEGLVTMPLGPLGVIPLTATSLELAHKMRPMAVEVARARQRPVFLKVFRFSDVLDTVVP